MTNLDTLTIIEAQFNLKDAASNISSMLTI